MFNTETNPIYSQSMAHCYHENDFPLLKSTPDIIQDPIDILSAKCILTKVLVFNACNTADLLMGKLHSLFLVCLLIDNKKVNHLHDNNVNTEARVKLLYVPLN